MGTGLAIKENSDIKTILLLTFSSNFFPNNCPDYTWKIITNYHFIIQLNWSGKNRWYGANLIYIYIYVLNIV